MSDSKKPDDNSPKKEKAGEKREQEVRYVPIEYMPHMHHPDDDDEIDLLELAKKIWDGRWMIVKITTVFIVFGVFWALFSPEEFESEAILMPEVQQEGAGGAGRLLQQFGGAFGLPGGGGSAPPGVIPPQIYPRIVNSLSFQLELLEKEIYFRDYDVTTTWPDFLENHYDETLTGYVLNYTVKLPFTILRGVRSLFSGDDSDVLIREDLLEQDFISLTREEFEIVKKLRERISVSQDQETGLLTTRVKLQDPRAAAELNRHLIELLKQYVTDYRIEKARQNLEFAELQRAEAEERFEQTQERLANFMDRNVNISTNRAQMELERLQDEKNLAFNVYNSLAQRVEESRLNLQEQTPIFSEVQPVNVPSERSEPKRALMVIVFTMLGGIISIGYVLISPLLGSFMSEMNS